ncbi:MAG: hypothetical protein AAB358_00955 [Patescibacteria group bacterium]
MIDPKIFKEYDIRGEYPWEIDEEAAYSIARAFVKFKKVKKIVTARDARKESRFVAEAFIRGLAESGCRVFDLGVDGTPALFFTVGLGDFDGGAMVTASHNPDGYTGFKLCGQDGVPIGKATGLEEIKKLRNQEIKKLKKPAKGRVLKETKKTINFLPDYYKFVTSFIDEKKIKPMKLVLDASGGSAVKLIDYIFMRLPGQVIKMNFKKGDRYPDHDLNPMMEKNRRSIQKEVKKQKARLGVIFDGDGDRCLFIDEKGNFVEPYYVNCLLSRIILKKKRGMKILVDARLPIGISEEIKNAGDRPVVGLSGYTNIIKLMREKRILFGCENSGHYFFNFGAMAGGKNFVYGDAIIPPLLILQYLSESGQKMSEAVDGFKKKYFISGELNFKGKNFEKIKEKIKIKFAGRRMEEFDGLSVFGDDWFFNIRASKTEPLVRLNIEAKNKEDLAMMKKELLRVIK